MQTCIQRKQTIKNIFNYTNEQDLNLPLRDNVLMGTGRKKGYSDSNLKDISELKILKQKPQDIRQKCSKATFFPNGCHTSELYLK